MNNEETIIQDAKDGDIIGHNSIVNGQLISTAKAVRDTFCCRIELKEMNSLSKGTNRLLKRFLPNN
jgi:hypothetical protein